MLFLLSLGIRFRTIATGTGSRFAQLWYAHVSSQLAQLLGIDRAVDMYEGQFFRLSANHHQASELVTILLHIDFRVVALGRLHPYDSRPAWTLQLGPDCLHIALRVLTIFIELEASNVNALQLGNKLL